MSSNLGQLSSQPVLFLVVLVQEVERKRRWHNALHRQGAKSSVENPDWV